MNKFYSHLHNGNGNFKNRFLRSGLLFFITVNVCTNANAQCEVNPVSNQVVCNNTATTAINFTGTATTFNWVNSTTSIGLASSGSGNIASFNALNNSATAVTATITVTPSTGACTGTPISFTITVNPSPVVTVSPSVSCGGVPGIGGPCNPLMASGNADIYIWSPLAGLYSNCTATAPYTGGNATAVYPAPIISTVYTVTGTNTTTGCTNTATAQVNNTPPPPVVTPPAVFMCIGDPPAKLSVAPTTNTSQFCSGPVNIPVPDNNPSGSSNSITVVGLPAAGYITGINVTINMAHTRIGDMVFVLKAPNGQVINLDYHLSATGGSGPTTFFLNTNISSVGTVALSTGTDPFTATFKADAQVVPAGGFGATGPTGMLPTATYWASLAPTTTAVNGAWTLGFYDGVTGNTGTLNSWCINIAYSMGSIIPSTPAVWSPFAGLYHDAAAAIPYTGAPTDIVYAKPVPAGVYPYQVTTQGLPLTLCTTSTNFINNSSNATVTFNVRNNHPFPIRLLQIDSRTFTTGPALVNAYYKTTAINGPPGAIQSSNGWVAFGSASITGSGFGVQPFMTALSLIIPPGATYGICLQAVTITNAPNLAYSALSPGSYSFNDGGCEIITGSNIGYSGGTIPAAPTTALSGFVGSLHFTETPPVCTSSPRTVIVTVGQPTTITIQPMDQNICFGQSAVFTVAASGSTGLTYQWQVSANGGSTYNNIANAAPYSGVTTATLTINIPSLGLSGNRYRVIVNGTAACAAVISGSALLTVNPLPVIVISANPQIILPGMTTTIHSIVTPNPAATYTWFYNGVLLAGATDDSLVVDINGLGDYQLSVTDINGCSGLSNIISITDHFALNLFVYPNPGSGQIQARFYSEANSVLPRSLVVYNNRGDKVLTKSFTQTVSYQRIDIDIRPYGKGLYWIALVDQNGKRLAMSRVVVQ